MSVWNKNQLMSLFQFYLYIAESLHVESGHQDQPQHTEHTARAIQTLNRWLCEQLCELS